MDWEQLRQLEAETERKLNRIMMPIILPMAITAGALLGLLVSALILPPLPQAFIGVFIAIALVFGFAPLAYVIWKYRQ